MINSFKLNNVYSLEDTSDIINVKNLNFSFNNKNKLFENANLNICSGDFACICGENGCGKSTFLKIILNLLKHDNKNIKINTHKLTYIPQSTNFNKDFPITVKEFLKFNCKELKYNFNDAVSLLEKYNLSNTLNTLIGNLSGGQLQKLIIVRAILNNPDLILIDEPTNNLDEKSCDNIYTHLKELNNNNITIVVVEHNKHLAQKYANKIFMVENGAINLV